MGPTMQAFEGCWSAETVRREWGGPAGLIGWVEARGGRVDAIEIRAEGTVLMRGAMPVVDVEAQFDAAARACLEPRSRGPVAVVLGVVVLLLCLVTFVCAIGGFLVLGPLWIMPAAALGLVTLLLRWAGFSLLFPPERTEPRSPKITVGGVLAVSFAIVAVFILIRIALAIIEADRIATLHQYGS